MILNIPPTLSQIRGVGALSFIGDGSALASSSKTQVYADGNAGNVTAGVPTGKVIKLAVAGTEVARFGGSGIDLKSPTGGYVAAYINGQDYLGIGYSNAVISAQRFALGRFGIASFSALYPGIACDANNIIHNVASGFFHDFKFANVLKYRLSSTLQEAPSLSLGDTVGSSTDGGIGSLALTNRIQFTGAGTADSTKSLIYADASAGNLFINVPTGKYHQWLVNGAPLFSLGAVGGTTTAGAWGLGAFGSTTTDITKPGFYCDANNLIYNVGSAYTHFFRVNNSSSASIDTNGFNVLKNITFAGAGSASSALSMMWADAANGNLFSNVPTGKYEQHRVAGLGSLSIGRASSVQGDSYWSIGQFASDGTLYSNRPGIYATSSMVLNVPSGNYYSIDVNNVEKYRLSSTLLEAPSVSLGGTIGSSVDGGAGSLALTNRVQFAGAGTIDTTKTLIHADAADGNLRIQAPAVKSVVTWIGTAQMFAVDSGGIYPGKGIIFSNSAGIANSAQTQIYPDGANGNLLINVPTGKSVALYVSGSQVLAIDANGIKLPVSASPASNGTGVAGQIAWDANYIYVCTATNTWKRAALTGGY